MQNFSRFEVVPDWSSHLCGLTQALRQKSDGLTEAQRSLQSAQTDRASAEERLRSLQRAVALLETEKRDAERQAVRLDKDKAALRNTLDKVRRASVCMSAHHV